MGVFLAHREITKNTTTIPPQNCSLLLGADHPDGWDRNSPKQKMENGEEGGRVEL